MSAPVFLLADGDLRAGATVVLDGPEGHHAATVQRLEDVILTKARDLRRSAVAG